jgi:hypothetical protein
MPTPPITDGSRLIFEEEIIFEKRKTRKDGEVNLADMDENNNLNNRVGIQMDEFNLEMVKETTEDVTTGSLNPCCKKALDTTILLVLGVGFPECAKFLSACRPAFAVGSSTQGLGDEGLALG